MKRRDFIALTSAIPLAAATSASGQTDPPKQKPKGGTPQIPAIQPVPGHACLMAGPMLGHVSETGAALWIQSTAATEWTVEISEQPDFISSASVAGARIDETTGFNSQVVLGDLKPSTAYHYRVWFGDRIVSHQPAASFTTASVVGSPGKLRFAFSSCVGRLPEHTSAAWGEINARSNFDLFLMLGDNHYADSTDLARQRLYYTAHRRDPAFRYFTSRIPLLGIWDDHDYGPNDSDTNAGGKQRSRQAFGEFWANPPRSEHPEDPAIYYTFQRGEVAFFMLDNRWHRSPNGDEIGPGKTMLGATQLAWLKRSLKSSPAKVLIIASGSEWQSNGHMDSWKSFIHERDEILDWIAAEKIPGVIFLSGDRHFAAGYQILDRWIELTGGPLGSSTERSPKAARSPETFTVHVEHKMWIIVEIDTTLPEPAIAYEIWGAGAGLIERRELAWAEVLGSEKIRPSESVARIK